MSKARDLADLGAVTSRLDTVGASDGALSNRNLIINGAMQVAQRGTSTAISGSYEYSPDRFFADTTLLDQYVGTVSQDSDAPDGFSNSLKITTTTAETTLGADEYLYIGYEIEAQDLQHINYGSSAAKEMTLSFWVKSSITGTYCVGLYATDAGRILNVPYTIDAANTWEYKTLKIVADTGGSGIDDDNGAGLRLAWTLSSGSSFSGTDSTSWIDYVNTAWSNSQTTNTFVTTASSTFFLTGVQLEVGDTATEFEHRSYGDELQRCRRYYQKVVYNGGSIVANGQSYSSGTQAVARVNYLGGEMRAVPSITLPTAGQGANKLTFLKYTTSYPTTTGTHVVTYPDTFGFRLNASGYSGLATSAGADVSWLYTGSGGSSGVAFQYDAEL